MPTPHLCTGDCQFYLLCVILDIYRSPAYIYCGLELVSVKPESMWNLYLYSRSYIFQSCNFQSRIFWYCIFHPCIFGPAFSDPVFFGLSLSSSAFWSLKLDIIGPAFSGPAFSGPAISAPPETVLDPRERFRVEVFLVSVDSLIAALNERLSTYQVVSNMLGFLGRLQDIT